MQTHTQFWYQVASQYNRPAALKEVITLRYFCSKECSTVKSMIIQSYSVRFLVQTTLLIFIPSIYAQFYVCTVETYICCASLLKRLWEICICYTVLCRCPLRAISHFKLYTLGFYYFIINKLYTYFHHKFSKLPHRCSV